jgi:hypothetical protein
MNCVLCQKKFKGTGNNPKPLADNKYPGSRCCDECDDLKVMPARLVKIGMSKENAVKLAIAIHSLKAVTNACIKSEELMRKKEKK